MGAWSRFPGVNAAEVAAIGETKDTFLQFKGNIDVHAVFMLVRMFQQLFGI